MKMDIKKAKVITEKSVRLSLDKSHKCDCDCACQENQERAYSYSLECNDC